MDIPWCLGGKPVNVVRIVVRALCVIYGYTPWPGLNEDVVHCHAL